MSNREKFLLLLTVVGFVAPNVMLGVYIADHGVDVEGYFGDWVATLPASQLLVDLLICLTAFIGWAAWDGPRSGVRRWWVTIPASGLVGLCFAIPLYLLMRERAIAEPGGVA